MANQFDMIAEGRTMKIQYQSEYGTWKVVDPDNEEMFWGGFKRIAGARHYARETLGATNIVVERIPS